MDRLRLRTKGFRRINNPQPVLLQKFNNDQIVLEFSKNNWSDTWVKVGIVRAVVREGGRWVQLGRPIRVDFGKQKITLDIFPISEYQIQIILVPWLPWVNCRLWEVIEE